MYKKVCKKLISIILIFFLMLFFITPVSFCDYESFIWSIPDKTTETSTNVIDSSNNFEKSNNVNNLNTIETSNNESDTSSQNSLKLESGSAILIEQNSGKILYEHNCHEQLRPASVTKVMTILLIMEALDTRKNFSNR